MLDLTSLVPACYAEFRPLVRDGAEFFMTRLPAPRLAAIAAEQTRLGATTPLEQRAVALLEQCPTLHKLGQVLARHPALDHALREQLQRLESLPARLTMADLGPLIEADLGAAADQIELESAPLAEGSVAVVVPFRVKHPAADMPAAGVLKILKPGIEALIEDELRIAVDLGAHLEARSREYGLPPLGYQAFIEQVATMLAAEIEPQQERDHLALAAELYAGSDGVRVPRLLPFHGRRITAMERIEGRKITEPGVLDERAGRRLAHRLVEALLARPFFSDDAAALFHGDPHAGNLMVDADERIVIIDWSLAGPMDNAARHAATVVIVGALTLDRRLVRSGVRQLLAEPLDEALVEREIAAAMATIPWRGLPGFDWLLALFDRLALIGGRFAPEFTVFRKALFTLNGVFKDVSASYSINRPLARAAVIQFYRELVPRMLTLPTDRRFGIPLTNAELLTLGVNWPITATRYWADAVQTASRYVSR